MKAIIIALCFVAVMLVASATGAPAALAAEPTDFQPGTVLVKFKPGVSSVLGNVSLSLQGLHVVQSIDSIGIHKIEVEHGRELESIAALRNNALVDYAEPDYVQHLLWTPNDPLYSYQWNLRKINMESAWSLMPIWNNIIVAVVDSGLDISHPDKPTNIASPVDMCNGSSVISDLVGHGTHVSGIIAARTFNGIGVAGVAPSISLMPVKVECSGIIYTFTMVAGIKYAADHGAKVINISLGSSLYSQTVLDVVNYAIGRGVLIVASAGNGYKAGNPVNYPAAYPGVLAVGASTYDDKRASYSQVHSYVGVVAPGGDASSSGDPDPNHWILSTYKGPDYYAWLIGTSMAAPHVSGLAGLILSVNPNLTNVQVTNIITSTAVDLGNPGRDNEFGYGRIDAYAALQKAQTPPATPTPAPSPVATATPAPTTVPTTTRIYLPIVLKWYYAGW